MRHQLGSREWRAQFHREQERFNRMLPWWVALSFVAGTVFLILILTGVLPVWLLFV